MGSVVSSIFGGQKYSAPDPVQYDPVPVRETEAEPESAAVRDAERRKLQARRGMSGTLLTSPLKLPPIPPQRALERFTFEKGETRGGGTAPPGPK